jgi:hypothetical protein
MATGAELILLASFDVVAFGLYNCLKMQKYRQAEARMATVNANVHSHMLVTSAARWTQLISCTTVIPIIQPSIRLATRPPSSGFGPVLGRAGLYAGVVPGRARIGLVVTTVTNLAVVALALFVLKPLRGQFLTGGKRFLGQEIRSEKFARPCRLVPRRCRAIAIWWSQGSEHHYRRCNDSCLITRHPLKLIGRYLY